MSYNQYSTTTPEQRFFEKVELIPFHTCWEWVGAKDGGGYGNFKAGGPLKAHRFSFTLHKGAIPDNFEVDHICRNHSCVNPNHLEAVPHQINVLRGVGPTAINAGKLMCIRGHALSGGNIYEYAHKRACRLCARERHNAKKIIGS